MSFEGTLPRLVIVAALAVMTPALTSVAHAEGSQGAAQGQ